MKPINIITLSVIVISALGMFQIKYYVQNLNKDHIELIKYVKQEKEAIHVLKAEWTYLNHPERLKKIIKDHLNLQIMNTNQIDRMNNNLPLKLSEINEEKNIEDKLANDFAKNIMNPSIPKIIKIKLVKNKASINKKLKPKMIKIKFEK